MTVSEKKNPSKFKNNRVEPSNPSILETNMESSGSNIDYSSKPLTTNNKV